MSLVEHALDGLPLPHRRLWLQARLTIQLAASSHYLNGGYLPGVIAVAAHPETLVGKILSRFGRQGVFRSCSPTTPVIGVLAGDEAHSFVFNMAYRNAVPDDGFTVILAPFGAPAGIATCRVLLRRSLH